MKRLHLITIPSNQVTLSTSTLFSLKENQLILNAKPIEIQTLSNLRLVLTFDTKLTLLSIDEFQTPNMFQIQNSFFEEFYDYKYSNGLPNEVNLFIEESKMAEDTANLLIEIMSKISDLLKSKNLQYELLTTLFIDYEYPEWKKIKLRIIVHKDLAYLYDNVKYPIYDLVDNGLPPELSDKILIKLESHKEHDTAN